MRNQPDEKATLKNNIYTHTYNEFSPKINGFEDKSLTPAGMLHMEI